MSPKPSKRRKKRKQKNPYIVPLVILSVVLVAGLGGIGLFLHFRDSDIVIPIGTNPPGPGGGNQPASGGVKDDLASAIEILSKSQYGDAVTVIPATKSKDPLNPSSKMVQMLDLLDRKDPAWRLQDIENGRMPVKREENGAIIAYEAFRTIPNDWKFKGIPSFGADAIIHRPLEDKYLRYAEAGVKQYPRELAVARLVRFFPKGRFRVEFTKDFHATNMQFVSGCHQLSKLLANDTVLRTYRGDIGGALSSMQANFLLGRYLSAAPGGVGQLGATACHANAVLTLEVALASKGSGQEQLVTKHLESIQQLLEPELVRQILWEAFRDERAGFHFMYTNVANNDVETPRYLQGSTMTLEQQHLFFVTRLTGLAEAGKMNAQKGKAIFDRVKNDVRQLGKQPIAGTMTDFDEFFKLGTLYPARVRCALAAVAAERHRMARGTWPQNLQQLVPDFLKEVPASPYDGKPLKMCVRPLGIIVYCLPTGVADGRVEFDPINLQNETQPIGFRLIHADKRF